VRAKSIVRCYSRYVAAVCAIWLLTGAGILRSQIPRKRAHPPWFSASAIRIDPAKTSTSPDREKRVGLRWVDVDAESFKHPADVLLTSGGEAISARTEWGLDAEALWSPDSQAFSWTGSCCGANGQYGTDVFFVRGGGNSSNWNLLHYWRKPLDTRRNAAGQSRRMSGLFDGWSRRKRFWWPRKSCTTRIATVSAHSKPTWWI
jgi:hypothetical protein